MMIEQPTMEEKKNLLPNEKSHQWDKLVKNIEALYDVNQIWSKGFGDWVYEYKFRYDLIRNTFSDAMNALYDRTESFHDGKWLWIPIDYDWSDIYNLLLIKRRPNKK